MKSWSRKPEVWVLLLASIVVAFWALSPSTPVDEWQAGSGAGDAAGAASGMVQLQSAAVERDYGNARLDLTLRIKNDSSYPLLLSPPKVRLLAEKREVPAFFLPAERPPEVAAKTTSEVKIRYWLEASDLSGPLVLDVQGEKVAVKSAQSFDLNQLESGKLRPLRGVDW